VAPAPDSLAGRRCAGPPSTGCGMTKDSAVNPPTPRILTIRRLVEHSQFALFEAGDSLRGFWTGAIERIGAGCTLQVKAQNRRTAFRGGDGAGSHLAVGA